MEQLWCFIGLVSRYNISEHSVDNAIFGANSYHPGKTGGVVAAAIAKRTSELSTNAAWRIPFSLFPIIPAIVSFLVWFIPEVNAIWYFRSLFSNSSDIRTQSPRWLLLKGHRNEAIAALKRLRRCQVSNEEIRDEIDYLATACQPYQQQANFKDLFAPLNWKRTWVVIMVNVFQQITGQAFASQYGTLFVKSLNTLQPFSITMGTNAIDIVALFICLATSDFLGRRFVPLCSFL